MKNFRGIFYALLSSSTFGLIPLFSIPLLEAGMGAPSILFYRLSVAALILGAAAAAVGKSFRITGAQALRIAGLGFLYATSCWGLLLSYRYIPSGMATTIHFLYPILVTFLMTTVFHEPKSPGLFWAAVVSLGGVGLMSWSDTSAVNVTGIALVLITVVAYGVYVVYVRQSDVSRIESLPLAFYILTTGGAIFAVYALCTTGIELPRGGFSVWGNIVLLALVPTVVSNFMLILAVKSVGSSITAILGSMEPVTAVMVGILHFGEPFDVKYALGLMLILGAVCAVIWISRFGGSKKVAVESPVGRLSEK